MPAEISNSAGTFVCNYVMYSLMDLLTLSSIPAGFIHIPADSSSSKDWLQLIIKAF
ncbi:MAG: hypothetical protein HQ557_08660 [Bacteroidetes bacterium]|nr:hypothetical protein [Bacteroidota bacterium]